MDCFKENDVRQEEGQLGDAKKNQNILRLLIIIRIRIIIVIIVIIITNSAQPIQNQFFVFIIVLLKLVFSK